MYFILMTIFTGLHSIKGIFYVVSVVEIFCNVFHVEILKFPFVFYVKCSVLIPFSKSHINMTF